MATATTLKDMARKLFNQPTDETIQEAIAAYPLVELFQACETVLSSAEEDEAKAEAAEEALDDMKYALINAYALRNFSKLPTKEYADEIDYLCENLRVEYLSEYGMENFLSELDRFHGKAAGASLQEYLAD